MTLIEISSLSSQIEFPLLANHLDGSKPSEAALLLQSIRGARIGFRAWIDALAWLIMGGLSGLREDGAQIVVLLQEPKKLVQANGCMERKWIELEAM